MRPSLRFLSLIVLGWAGVRAASFGVLPGAEFFRIEPSEAKVPPIVATQFPAIEPVQPATPILPADASAVGQPVAFAATGSGLRYVQGVVGVPVTMRPGVVTVYQLPPATPAPPDVRPAAFATAAYAEPAAYTPLPPLQEGPLAQLASLWPTSRQSVSMPPAPTPPVQPHLDRIQLSAWALLRAQQAGIAGPQSLANGGSLGGSQAATRLTYNVTRQLAATFRASSDVGRRGGEVAAGVRVRPLMNIPLWLTAERRQRVGRYGGGRSAFALFFEGGLWNRPLPWRFTLDAYLQGGIVGIRSRDKFIDGGLAFTRPIYKQFSAGFGVWGGAQPGVFRVDAGPRITMRVRNNVRVHFDWRQRLAGNAAPGSGPAITLAGDF